MAASLGFEAAVEVGGASKLNYTQSYQFPTPESPLF